MAEFLTAYNKTAQCEGGYSNHPNDKGKETYAGISRKFHANWKGWAIIDSYKPLKNGQIIKDDSLKSLIKQFYYTNFWQPIQGDYIEHQNIANFVYDWRVNSGSLGVKQVQKAMGLKDDGKVGNRTLQGLNNVNIEILKQSRIDFINNIVKKDPSQNIFLEGWLNRINSF